MNIDNRLPIRILNDQFVPVADIKSYSSLRFNRSQYGVGELEMHINRHLPHADKLTVGAILVPYNRTDCAYQIKTRSIKLDQSGKNSEVWVIYALPLKSWLNGRITMPVADYASDAITSDGETVLHHYLDTQVINPIAVEDKMDIVAGPNGARGEQVEWQSRYKDLGEEMAQISLLGGVGWNIDMDMDSKQFVFNTRVGRDSTVGNSAGNNPVIFSPEFKTLREMDYSESDLDYKNVAVVAGQGEGADRRIVVVGDTTAIGFNRRVMFVDARDISEMTDGRNPRPKPEAQIIEELQNRGLQKLAEQKQEVYLSGQAIVDRQRYLTDYDLGDTVTLQYREWGVTLNTMITGTSEVYEQNGYSVTLTFDNDRPDLISKIKKALSDLKIETTR